MATTKRPKSQGNRDVLIALLGLTGAGKSTFVNVACGEDKLKVGHSIYPCTQQPETVRFALDGRTIVLIDTPGFDDDNRSDVQILEDISKWMAEKGYLKSNQLDGLVLLHPVTMHRVGGTERRRTKLFQTILGEKAYKRVIIATTMWEQMVSENDVKERIAGREKDLWRDFVSKGSKVRRHQNNQESAHKIIREVIAMSEKYGKLEPLLHKELVMNPLLVESSAGRVTKEQLEAEIKRARELIREHEKKRPEQIQKRYRMIQQKKWKAWRCWNDEKKTLEQRLDSLQLQLKRLNSLSFKLKDFFTGLFGG